MSETTHERATAIFGEACELDRDRRDEYIASACAGDPALLERVRELISHDSETASFFSAAKQSFDRPGKAEPRTPEAIGRYTVIGRLGVGGSGVVYRCEQQSPKRTVAVKLLRRNALGDDERRRFLEESQHLASLQHPNIAGVLDAGFTTVRFADGAPPDEQPFIAMEFIDGVTLDEFVRREALGIRETARLLIDICGAVHHAHQRMIIHRDLKPANILVDDEGRARVLDFGIASRRDRSPEKGNSSSASDLEGTLAYMAPELLDGSSDGLDLRADVYALGIIAHTLLAGGQPFDLKGLTLPEAMRRIVSGERTPNSGTQALAKDLALAIEKAIAANPDDRYTDAGAFADDLSRFLKSEPISAHPQTAAYIASKFYRRHTGAVLGAGAAIAALAFGLVLMSMGYVHAQRARAEAEYNAANQGAMAEYLEAVVFGADPDLGGAGLSYLDALGYASGRIEDVLVDHPAAEAHARSLVGFVLRRHGRYEQARAHLTRALRLRTDELGERHPLTARSMQELAVLVLEHDGRADEAALMLERAITVFSENNAHEQDEAWARISYGYALLETGRAEHAREQFDAAEALIVSAYEGPFEIYRVYPARARAEASLRRGDAQHALDETIPALQRIDGVPNTSHIAAQLWLTRARAESVLGMSSEALSSLRDAQSLFTETVGADHPFQAEILIERAVIDLGEGATEPALASLALAKEISEGHAAPTHRAHAEIRALESLARYSASGGANTWVLFDAAATDLITHHGSLHPRVHRIMRMAARAADDHGEQTRAELIREWLGKAHARTK